MTPATKWCIGIAIACAALVLAVCVAFFLSIATTGNITNLQLPTL